MQQQFVGCFTAEKIAVLCVNVISLVIILPTTVE